MKNRILLSLLLLFPTFAAAQSHLISIPFGSVGAATAQVDRTSNNANLWHVYGFVPKESKTINEACIYVQTKSGTLGASDYSMGIYLSTSLGKPTSVQATSTTVSPALASTTLSCFTGFSFAATAGRQYWFVVKNLNGTPASNNITIRVPGGGRTNQMYGGSQGNNPYTGFAYLETSDGGTNWNNVTSNGGSNIRIKYSDNTYDGFAVSYPIAAADQGTGNRVYSARELGNLFTTPANFTAKLKCISFPAAKIGSPTGNLRYRLYQGTTLVDTTNDTAEVATFGVQDAAYPLCFNTAVQLAGSTAYRIVMAESTQSDTSSNTYAPMSWVVDSSTPTQNLRPFNGTMQKTLCTSSCNGGTWTETSTEWFGMALFLDFGNEFGSSGGGLKNLNTLSGGTQ